MRFDIAALSRAELDHLEPKIMSIRFAPTEPTVCAACGRAVEPLAEFNIFAGDSPMCGGCAGRAAPKLAALIYHNLIDTTATPGQATPLAARQAGRVARTPAIPLDTIGRL